MAHQPGELPKSMSTLYQHRTTAGAIRYCPLRNSIKRDETKRRERDRSTSPTPCHRRRRRAADATPSSAPATADDGGAPAEQPPRQLALSHLPPEHGNAGVRWGQMQRRGEWRGGENFPSPKNGERRARKKQWGRNRGSKRRGGQTGQLNEASSSAHSHHLGG